MTEFLSFLEGILKAWHVRLIYLFSAWAKSLFALAAVTVAFAAQFLQMSFVNVFFFLGLIL